MAYDKEETFKKIIRYMSDDAFSLGKICRMEDMPNKTTVYEWLDEDEEKANQYARATVLRSEVIFEQVLTIADATSDDIITDEDGNKITNNNVIQRDRLRVDSRKWMLGKMQPKKYGEKLDITSKGDKIKDSAIAIQIVTDENKGD